MQLNSGTSVILGGSELTVLMTFQLPVVPLAMMSVLSSIPLLLVRYYGVPNLQVQLSASTTGSNSGNVSATFSYTSTFSSAVTLSTPLLNPANFYSTSTQPITVPMPMLFGGWVTVAFSVSAAGAATLSVRDIFSANNASVGAFAPLAPSLM